MKVHFYLRFHTQFGQRLFITGNNRILGGGDPHQALIMEYMNEEYWQLSVEIDPKEVADIQYSYILEYDDGTRVAEWGDDRIIGINRQDIDELQVMDTWNHAGEFENAFYSAPFQETLLKPQKTKYRQKQPKLFTHVFRVKAPLLEKDQILALTGSGAGLGDWNALQPQLMMPEGHWWECRVQIPMESLPVVYKYGVYDKKHGKFLHFENGANRLLHGDALQKKITLLHDGFVNLPNNTWRGAGVAIPVFSLRSRQSFGVGEFRDLRLLVDWARRTGLKLIQILPVNDTSAYHSWADSYPYAAISAFALHPIYLHLESVAGKKHSYVLKSLEKKRKELNEFPALEYEEVIRYKLSVIKELFNLLREEWEQDESFKEFFEKNQHWLVPYAAFCTLRDLNGSPDFTTWKVHKEYNRRQVDKFVARGSRHYDAVLLHYFIQYHLHLQLRDATDYAHKHGIVVKGDIPIGIYRYSCDAWIAPELYHMDMQAGAPPDDFALRGQNWGFPTYNWEQMAKDGFLWWKKRFEQMSNYFDAFRIDHILGFFRIWSIPLPEVDGLMGHFDPALPVTVQEFSEKNIFFNYYRYTAPFINDAILWEFFQEDGSFVKENFLVAAPAGQFELKETYNHQRKVLEYFETQEQNERNERIRDGLLALITNIILFEAEGSEGRAFHFRFGMEETPSFRYLDWHTQHQLSELYVNYFYRRQDHFWQEQAMKKLPALKRETNMLVCGEDLGMVPACVPEVMKQLGILSLEIQRMPKDPSKEFFHPADAPYLSVVTPSTHDMSTIRGWWEEDHEKTQRFFNHQLGQWGEAPFFCEPWINKAVVIQHLYSPAMWSIFQLQDLMGMSETMRRENPHDERINVPANPKNRWQYRMHLYLEDLVKEKPFNDELKAYVEASGR